MEIHIGDLSSTILVKSRPDPFIRASSSDLPGWSGAVYAISWNSGPGISQS